MTSNSEHSARILVIDDEEIVHASINKIIKRLGHKVYAVFSAAEGLERLKNESFQLVITDLMMPEMTGIEFLEAAAEMDAPPIIMVTGYPTIRTAVQALRLGATDYVAKPFTRKELLSPVKRALRTEKPDKKEEKIKTSSPAPTNLITGDVVYLPNHSWVEFEQEGTFKLGIEGSFLKTARPLKLISSTEEMEIIEQGFVGIKLTNTEKEVHGVVMPLSGQVIEVNWDAIERPSELTSSQWLLRIVPTQLQEELELLVSRK